MSNSIEKLKILILEDIATDAELVHRKLKKANLKYESVTVDTKIEFRKQVREFKPDLILSDYSMPQFNAMEALEFLNKEGYDIPFILVTGSQSEEVAVECIKKGAADYILKTSLTRLPAAVENALQKKQVEEENKKFHLALIESEQRFKSLFENNPDAVYSFDLSGKFLNGNSALTTLTGYTIEELKGKPFLPIVHPDYLEITMNGFSKAAKGDPQNYSNAGIHKNGKIFYTNVTNIPIIVNGVIVGVYGIAKDITEKKQNEDLIKQNNIHLEFIVNMQREILSSATNLNEILKIAAVKTQELIQSDGVTIEMLEDDYLVYKSVSGNLASHLGKKIKLVGSLSGLSIRTGNILISENTEIDDRVDLLVCRKLNIGSMVVLPIYFENKNIGVLKVSFTKSRKFADEEIRVLKLVTGFIAAALNLASEFEEKQKNINEKNKVLQLLSESETRYRMLAENSFDIIATHDKNGAFMYVSPACKMIFGYDPEELIGKLPSQFVHPDDLDHFLSMKKERLSGKNNLITVSYRMLKKDGTYCWIESTSNKYEGNKGEIDSPYLISITRDITERKKNESVQLRLGQLLNNSLTEVFFIESESLKFIQVNQAALNKMGYTYEEMMNMTPFDIDPHFDREKFRKLISPLLNGEVRETIFNGIHVRKDGATYPVEIRLQYSSQESPPVFLSIVQDITERKAAEAELKLLHKSIEEINDLIIITEAEYLDDPGPRIIFVNESVNKITGYKKEEIIGKNPRILQGPKTNKEALYRIKQALENQQVIKEELLNYSKSGNEYWIELSITPVKNESGKCTHFIAVERDITERKKNHQELIEAKEKAEEMNRLKSNFLANMSHELRTPMIGILGYSEILCNEIQDAEHKEMVEVINSSGHRLLETLNLLLDLSRIESGKMELQFKEIDLVSLVEQRCKLFASAAKKKSLFLNLDLPSAPIISKMDERLFSEIVNHLVNNAIKFTETGGVSVSFKKIVNPENEYTLLTIKDTGIGISREQINVVFEDFRQSSEGFGRRFEGTGLGLSLTKKFVDKLGGEITVISEPEKGSTFNVKLPLNVSPLIIQKINKQTDSTGEFSVE